MSIGDKLLKKANLFEKLAVYGDRSSFLKSLAQNTTSNTEEGTLPEGGDPIPPLWDATDTTPKQNPGYFSKTLQYFQNQPPNQPPKKPTQQLIPTDIQNMLSQILVSDGIESPLVIDGILGPLTQKSINTFKQKYNVPSNFSNQDVFEVIKNTYSRTINPYNK